MRNTLVRLMEASISEAQRTEQVQEALARNPRQMTMLLARRLDLPEEAVVRAMPEGASVPLDVSRWEQLMAALEALGEVHVIVSNGSTTMETTGRFGGMSSRGGFFNVQSDDLDMHIQRPKVRAAYAVRKASHFDGHETLSVQFFDHTGTAAFKVFLTFGGGEPAAERRGQFEDLIGEFSLG
jgi:putative heme utilization carrier protein HutX